MKIRTIAATFSLASALMLGAGTLVGCEKHETAADKMDDAKNNVKDAAHDASNNVKDAAHDVKNDVKDAAH